jgi:4-amino-4-deoxy-L-arabinose transferase-like glycosyltransferase
MRARGPDAALPTARTLLVLTVLAFAVRAVFVLLEPATRPVADERTWTNWAVESLSTPRVAFSPLRTHMIFYPPLYPYFIAAPYGLFHTLEAAKWAQAVVGSLLIPAVGLVGARVFGPRAGLVAAGIAAFYPDLVWFAAHFWSETLFLVLLWWAIERLIAGDARGSTAATAGAGLLWGLAILTRETILYLTPVAAAWLAWRAGRAGATKRAAAFLLCATIVVVPWTVRNWLQFGAFVPVATSGGLALFQGNARLTREEVYARYEAVHGRIEQYRFARREGWRAIGERQPWWAFEKLREQMPRFWEADSLALIHIKRGAYGAVAPATAVAAAVVVLAPYLVVLAGFVAGVALLPLDRRRVLLVGFLLAYNALHVVTHGFARYRLPVMPVVFVFAAAAYVAWRGGALAGAGASGTRRAVAAVLGLVLLLCLVPSFRMNLGHPAFGFVDQAEPGAFEPASP